jgi:hypothetical protein
MVRVRHVRRSSGLTGLVSQLTARFEESIRPGSIFDVCPFLNLATLNAVGESMYIA